MITDVVIFVLDGLWLPIEMKYRASCRCSLAVAQAYSRCLFAEGLAFCFRFVMRYAWRFVGWWIRWAVCVAKYIIGQLVGGDSNA